MAAWIETELKLLLPDEAAWRRVRSALGAGRPNVQTNHFFDRADGGLRSARIGVRLREEAGRTTLTVKADRAAAAPGVRPAVDPPGASGAVASRIELESDLPLPDFERALVDGLDLMPWLSRWRVERAKPVLDPELATFLDGLAAHVGGQRLQRRAGFVNERELRSLALADRAGAFEVELALDRTVFPGGRVDHELEIELEGAPRFVARVEAAVRSWLASLGGIEGRPAPSKLARLDAQLEASGARS